MRRREFLSAVGGAILWSTAARSQQTALIGIIGAAPGMTDEKRMVSFGEGLKEIGFILGQNVTTEYRFAEGDYDRLPRLAAELVARRVQVIVTPNSSSAALAAKSATQDIPIVFSTTNDPVKLGLVSSLARPGLNITGVNTFSTELGPKRLGLLRELLPGARVFAVLLNPTSPTSQAGLQDMENAARAAGVQIRVLKASTGREIDAGFNTFERERPDGFLVINDPLFTSRRSAIISLAAGYRIPAIYSVREYAEAGGLMSYSTDVNDVYRQLGNYTGQILKGAKPEELPVVQPTKFELVINLKAAKALGLEMPPTLLAGADEIIE